MLDKRTIEAIEKILSQGKDVQIKGDRGRIKVFAVKPKLEFVQDTGNNSEKFCGIS